jgi:hypothetical protein
MSAFFLFFINTQAKKEFYKCKLIFTNSNIVEGFATMPTNKSMDNKIRYKKNKTDDDVIKLDGERLNSIIFFLNENKQAVLINTKFYKTLLTDKSEVESKLFRNYWMAKIMTSEKLFVYWLSEDYKLNKDGNLSCVSGSNMALGDYETVVLVKRPDEQYPTMISFHSTGYVTNGDKFFKRIALAYFKDNKKLLKKIKKNEFGLENYDALVRDYCDCNYQDSFYIHY